MRLQPIPVIRLAGIARDTLYGWRLTASFLASSRDSHLRGIQRQAGESPHLLLLARNLPPNLNGGIYRPTALIKAADRRGWRITAITKPLEAEPTPAGLELFRTIPSSVRIVPYEPPVPRDASHYFSPRLSGGFEVIASIVDAARRACGDVPPSMVMASGPPFSEFVAGLVLSQIWGIPLVLDYRDEWTECPFRFVGVGNVDWFWERRCLRRAARVFFTTESQRQHQIRKFPQLDPARSLVAPNGAHDDTPRGMPVGSPGSGIPTIAYLGLLGEHCDLGEFLQTLEHAIALDPSLARRMQLVFVGTKTPSEREVLARFSAPGMLSLIDHVPLSEAQAIMRQSSALLLFNPPRLARYIPGKAYDYIATGKRVLLYGEGGELDQLLVEYPPAVRVNRQHPGALRDALNRIVGGRETRAPGTEFLNRCNRARSAERQMMVLEELLPPADARVAVA